MKRIFFMAVFMIGAGSLSAEGTNDFRGRWNFNAAESKNVGSMAQASVVSVARQTSTTLTVDSHSVFGGTSIDDHTTYDLTGAPAQNASKMSGTGTARSQWLGTKLVTEWTISGAVPGSTTTRTETRYLSPDGKTMFVESIRAGATPVVMAFDRTQ